MDYFRARIRLKQPDGSVEQTIVAFPFKTDDAPFRFLEEFEKKCGGPIADSERDKRWDAVVKAHEPVAEKQQPKRRRR